MQDGNRSALQTIGHVLGQTRGGEHFGLPLHSRQPPLGCVLERTAQCARRRKRCAPSGRLEEFCRAPRTMYLCAFVCCGPVRYSIRMSQVLEIEVPDDVTLGKGTDAKNLAREMRLAAAVKWYEIGMISQGKAAEVAGLSRNEFI